MECRLKIKNNWHKFIDFSTTNNKLAFRRMGKVTRLNSLTKCNSRRLSVFVSLHPRSYSSHGTTMLQQRKKKQLPGCFHQPSEPGARWVGEGGEADPVYGSAPKPVTGSLGCGLSTRTRSREVRLKRKFLHTGTRRN